MTTLTFEGTASLGCAEEGSGFCRVEMPVPVKGSAALYERAPGHDGLSRRASLFRDAFSNKLSVSRCRRWGRRRMQKVIPALPWIHLGPPGLWCLGSWVQTVSHGHTEIQSFQHATEFHLC